MNKTWIYAAIFVMAVAFAPAYAGAATVSGKVNFSGTAPEREPLNMGADPTCASFYDGPALSEEVVVNENGTLKNVFVYVKEGLEGQNFEAPTEPVTLDQKGCHYEPHVFGVMVGQPVQIVNSDTTLHNVHALPEKQKEFNLGMPIKGMKLKKTFSEPEVMVKFKCDVHPWMRAYAGVLSHPYYDTTGDEGSFKIADLAPGTYTLEAWHEKYGTQTQEVTVTEGQDTAVEFTFNA